ncbi:hypothetical protein AB0B01_20365 [Streptomyces sp. NPDC044571]|uniref:hypothetical protein n=1 Tax=Streptomyces sp. NPDC044571 TaxID=3155371 RepID=UPI0033D038F8
MSRRSVMRLLGAVGQGLGAGGCADQVAPDAPARNGPPAAATLQGGAPRIDALLAELTLEEKTALLHGGQDPAPLGQAGCGPGVPRLGIPALRLPTSSAPRTRAGTSRPSRRTRA